MFSLYCSASLFISNSCHNCSIYSNRLTSWSWTGCFRSLLFANTRYWTWPIFRNGWPSCGIHPPVQQWNPILTPRECFRSKPKSASCSSKLYLARVVCGSENLQQTCFAVHCSAWLHRCYSRVPYYTVTYSDIYKWLHKFRKDWERPAVSAFWKVHYHHFAAFCHALRKTAYIDCIVYMVWSVRSGPTRLNLAIANRQLLRAKGYYTKRCIRRKIIKEFS